jgi:hypothetical protein
LDSFEANIGLGTPDGLRPLAHLLLADDHFFVPAAEFDFVGRGWALATTEPKPNKLGQRLI